jgi:hypothetical protein
VEPLRKLFEKAILYLLNIYLGRPVLPINSKKLRVPQKTIETDDLEASRNV